MEIFLALAICIAALAWVWEIVDAREFRRRLDSLETSRVQPNNPGASHNISLARHRAEEAMGEAYKAQRNVEALLAHLKLSVHEEPAALVVRKRES